MFQPSYHTYCEHIAKHREDLKDHVYDKHSDILMLQSMAQQMDTISKSFEVFESFKGELTNVLKSIFDNQNAMRQELFLIRNKQFEKPATVVTKNHINH